MRRAYVFLLILVIAGVPSHTEAQTDSDVLGETGEWLRSKLEDYGSFRLRATVEGVTSLLNLIAGDAELRLEIEDVSTSSCILEYTYTIREGMMGHPSISKVTIPLASVDVSSIVEEPLELDPNIRLEGIRSQVFVMARRDAESFVLEVDRQEEYERSILIFIDSRRHAREVAEKMKEAVGICSGG